MLNIAVTIQMFLVQVVDVGSLVLPVCEACTTTTLSQCMHTGGGGGGGGISQVDSVPTIFIVPHLKVTSTMILQYVLIFFKDFRTDCMQDYKG